MKIGLLGKMASGKTTTAKIFKQYYPQLEYMSFADPIRQIARDVFNMFDKDRELFQSIGSKMREIDSDVWVNYTVRKSRQYLDIIIDDVRYLNEIQALKREGFTIIYLAVTLVVQRSRLLAHYLEDASQHLERLNHESEQADQLSYLADHTIQADTMEELTNAIRNLLIKN